MAESEKAKLYNEIVRRTSEKVMLERMRLYGFWPAGEGLPQDPLQSLDWPADLSRRRLAAVGL